MAAWVLIVDTPWFGRAGADGRVLLPQVPAGAYRLRVWHASLPVGAPASDRPLTVGAAPQHLVLQLPGTMP